MRAPTSDASPRAGQTAAVASRDVVGLPQLTPEMKASIRLLVVDDERTLRESCASVLEYEGYQVSVCSRGDEARETLKRKKFDVVLLDLYMPEVPGMRLLRTCLEAHPDTIVIVITGNPTVDSSLEALRAGAWDYLPKPFSATHLQILLGRAAHAVMVARESQTLQADFAREHGNSERVTLLGTAPAFRQAVELARKVAHTDASVFITGESGSGKELIAQFIHQNSRRSSREFVALNCAALPEGLLESEMFGHRKGAFTGAVRDKPGLLETANGGTLFLDELVGDAEVDSGEIAARDSGWRGAARRKRNDRRRCECAIHRRHQQRSGDRRRVRSHAGRSLLPPPGRADLSCRRSGSARRTFPSSPNTSSRRTGPAIAAGANPRQR